MEQPFWPKEARERKFGLLKNRGSMYIYSSCGAHLEILR